MAAKSKQQLAAQREAAAERRVQAAARKTLAELVPQAIELLGAAPPMGGGTGMQTVSLPVAGAHTMIGTLRSRPNWYSVTRREIDNLARLVAERNWFARSVHESRLAVYGMGFRFEDAEANAWAESGDYPFARYQKDMIEEWLISRNLVVWWRKEMPSGELPALNVPNNGDVDYDVIGGVPQISLSFPRKSGLPDAMEEKLGKRLFEAIKKGKKLVIPEGDEEFDFRVMKSGKSAVPGFQVSPLVTIFDDLDFVEAIRVGDWNGAKARWEIIRHTKKGYGVSSGQNAGTKQGHAKAAELKAIVKAMKEILGKTDIATNYDQEIGYVEFPKDHFHPELLGDTRQRLLNFAGVFGILLLKTDSQIAGLGDFMMQMLRTEVLAFREEFGELLRSIFASDSFAAGVKDGIKLKPRWSVKPLYSAKAFNELIVTLHTYGLSAPQSLRELFDIDDELESLRMLKAHEDPMRYTPPFEPRQGIVAGLVAPEDESGNQKQNSLPGEPGRPTSDQ